jgi:putative tryptophan/tyrosine transport system substrate-binding protein
VRRRQFIAGLGSAAAWPLAARGQQVTMPVVGFVSLGSAAAFTDRVLAFRRGLSETGFVEGPNVTVEYHWLEGKYDGLPALMADLVRRRVAVIATPGNTVSSLAAKAATPTIPIVFAVGDDPVRLGLVASLARPGGNATGFNFFATEMAAKRLGLLHELVPKAVRVAVLVNPANVTNIENTLRDLREAARVIGLQIHVLNAGTSREIDEAFATGAIQSDAALRQSTEGRQMAAATLSVGVLLAILEAAPEIRVPFRVDSHHSSKLGGKSQGGRRDRNRPYRESPQRDCITLDRTPLLPLRASARCPLRSS